MNPHRKIIPDAPQITRINIPHPTPFTLENGVKGLEICAGTEEVVRLELLYRAGAAVQTAPLVASATANMLTRGTRTKSAAEIAEMIDFHGAFLETETGNDFMSLTLLCLSKHLDAMLPLIREIITEPVFPEQEFKTWVNQSKQNFLIEQRKVASAARRKFSALVFPKGHPYHSGLAVESFGQLTLDQVRNYWDTTCKGRLDRILLSGLTSPTTIQKINEAIGDLAQIENAAQTTATLPEYVVSKEYEKRDDAVQSAIWIGMPAVNRTHTDYFGLKVLTAALGGYFGSRLMKNIREDKGYSYGISAGMVAYLQGSFFYIATEVGVDVTNATLKEIYKEIGRLTVEEIADNELNTLRNYMLGSFMRSLDGPFALTSRAKSLIGYDLNFSYYQQYVDELRGITSAKLLALAKKYFAPQNFSEVVVGAKNSE